MHILIGGKSASHEVSTEFVPPIRLQVYIFEHLSSSWTPTNFATCPTLYKVFIFKRTRHRRSFNRVADEVPGAIRGWRGS